jgi:thiamine pyrophosphokinase
MTAVIICNGSVSDYKHYDKYFENAEYVICADGGAVHARKFGILPDVLIGDFDSIPEDILTNFEDQGVEVLRYPIEKDLTDTELAVNYACEKGFTSIVFIGALGTRFDHSLSNIFMLKGLLDRGINGTIVDEHNEITIIKDSILLKKEKGIKISLLPLSAATEGVTTEGLCYPLNEETLKMGSTRGISNEFVSDVAQIGISGGLLVVIKSND